MLEYKCKPIVKWPGELTRNRERSLFDTPWGKTLDLLEKELRYLRGKNPIMQIAVTEAEIRLDGRVYANARPSHPGVILTFDSKHGPLSYHTDRYTEFQDNVRAIVLSLEALRKVDRYGVSKEGSQYAGYKRLPPAGEATKRITTADEAATFIEKQFPEVTAAQILSSSPLFETAYRQSARRLHPDHGGDNDAWIDLQDAAAILKKKHGAS